MDFQMFFILAASSCLLGYISFRVYTLFMPKRLKIAQAVQRKKIIEDTKLKSKEIMYEELRSQDQILADAKEDFEQELEQLESELKSRDEEIEQRFDEINRESQSVEARFAKATERMDKVKALESNFLDLKEKLDGLNQQISLEASKQAGIELVSFQKNTLDSLVSRRDLELKDVYKAKLDFMTQKSGRIAERVLSSVHSVYAPDFVWPKGVSHLEIPSKRLLLKLQQSNSIEQLTSLTDQVTIEIKDQEEKNPYIRFVGGFGIDRESAKIAMTHVMETENLKSIPEHYQQSREKFMRQAEKYGVEAAKMLGLDHLHVEVLKMVGFLNWRTSYRQNQFFHSVEVAKLAGIVANELGEDEKIAKRCGLLHDIGKSIDYRFDGSHAVVSADYADRFGETREVCDTVLSHHDDLYLETTMAHILKTADTLSGARPGARVNLEEGYQDRLSSIGDVVHSFPGISKFEIMNGARELHVEVDVKKIKEDDIPSLATQIARKLEEEVAFPGQIKITVSRKNEYSAVA